MTTRTFVERIPLLCNFAARVDALPSEAWQRLHARCQPLAGTTPAALFARAQLSARAYQVFPDLTNAPVLIRAMPLLSNATIVTMGVAFEVLTSAFPSLVEPPWTRRGPASRPEFERCIDAQNAIEHTLARQGMRIAGVATAVRAAARAILSHDALAPATFQRVYRWVESEIPYEQIDPLASSARAVVD